MLSDINKRLKALENDLDGELKVDDLHRMIYATDASVYRERPAAVAFPRDESDLIRLVDFCTSERLPLIPRAAGTSLAGQVVGHGIICDTSRYFTSILDLDEDNRTVRLQPGVIRDVLNQYLHPKGLFFGPNTSTSNRCNLGGMIGNNSAGTTSIKYGTTRDKILDMRIVTSDGQVLNTASCDLEDRFQDRPIINGVLDHIKTIYDDQDTRQMILNAFPRLEIHRRNTGYALDDICRSQPFDPSGKPFNLARVLCGSEGTLALTSEAVLQLDPLPPSHYSMVTMGFSSVHRALLNVGPAMSFQPYQCELMDDVILRCTESQPKYKPFRALISGQPKAVLMIELRAETPSRLKEICHSFSQEMKKIGLADSIQLHDEGNSDKLWDLRKAGLGLLANLESEGTAVACIEDTAVGLDDLPAYIDEFESLMEGYGQSAVYYAHAGAGELHLRPILDLRTPKGKQDFVNICRDSAMLVKKYKGSLSGEHGDGRVRAPFIEDMVGTEVYGLMAEMKQKWDPQNIFNPGKIVDPAPIDQDLRYIHSPERPSFYRYHGQKGVTGMAEKCNGSGDCRKPQVLGGTMCPSYHATREEKDTTRARANSLREVLSSERSEEVWTDPALAQALDLCLSCKGCQRECPSNVDMAMLKSEYQYQYYRHRKRPLRDILFTRLPEMASRLPLLTRTSLWLSDKFGGWIKPLMGIHRERPLPRIHAQTLMKLAADYRWQPERINERTVVLLADEFTDLFEPRIGRQAIFLLEALDLEPMLSPSIDSCRAQFSKGFLEEARQIVDRQLHLLEPVIKYNVPLIGLEPSAILGIPDEWIKVCSEENLALCRQLSTRAATIEEFLYELIKNGRLSAEHFETNAIDYHVHGHCHFKAQVDEDVLYHLLSVLPGSTVRKIPSGCCGMAGSFGYEEEHFEISRNIGELILFPYLRELNDSDVVVANGISCRHQIDDMLNLKAMHPVEVLYNRLKRELN